MLEVGTVREQVLETGWMWDSVGSVYAYDSHLMQRDDNR